MTNNSQRKNEMNIDDMTYGQLKQIAALFGGAAKANPLAEYVGKTVVVRDHRAGVYFGVVESVAKDSVTLEPGSRQAYYWQQGGTCAGLAHHGPSGDASKITPPAVGRITLLDLVAIHECSLNAIEQWQSMPEWSGQ